MSIDTATHTKDSEILNTTCANQREDTRGNRKRDRNVSFTDDEVDEDNSAQLNMAMVDANFVQTVKLEDTDTPTALHSPDTNDMLITLKEQSKLAQMVEYLSCSSLLMSQGGRHATYDSQTNTHALKNRRRDIGDEDVVTSSTTRHIKMPSLLTYYSNTYSNISVPVSSGALCQAHQEVTPVVEPAATVIAKVPVNKRPTRHRPCKGNINKDEESELCPTSSVSLSSSITGNSNESLPPINNGMCVSGQVETEGENNVVFPDYSCYSSVLAPLSRQVAGSAVCGRHHSTMSVNRAIDDDIIISERDLQRFTRYVFSAGKVRREVEDPYRFLAQQVSTARVSIRNVIDNALAPELAFKWLKGGDGDGD